MTTLKKAEWPPRLAAWLRKAKYRKHYVFLDLSNTVTIRQNRDWSGGTKDSQWAIHARTGVPTFLTPKNPQPWPQREAEETIATDDGWVYIQGGTFCGKPAAWHLTMTEATWAAEFK